MQASEMLDPLQLGTLFNIAKQYNVDPNLILAIGWHETNWGRAGDGTKGMYTGYGSYDSGSDYTLAGFKSQVTGTAKKMAAWGMTPGNVTLERIQTGNSGALPTGIYATDGNWPNAVWNIYTSLKGTPTTSTTTSSKLPGDTISTWNPSTWEKIKMGVEDTWYWLKGTTKSAAKYPSAAEQLQSREFFNAKYGTELPTAALEQEISYQNSLKLSNKIFTAGTLTVIFLIVVIFAFFSFFKAFDVEPPAVPKPV